jgi:hypothetical protein
MIRKTHLFLFWGTHQKTWWTSCLEYSKPGQLCNPYVILCMLFTSIFLEKKHNFKEILHTWLKFWYWSPQVGSCLSINRKAQKFDHIPGTQPDNLRAKFFVVLLYQEWAHDCSDGKEVLGQKVGSWERVTGKLIIFPPTLLQLL